jgi:hypothetical protein
VRSPAAIPSEQWHTGPTTPFRKYVSRYEYPEIFERGVINSLIAKWAVILNNFLLPEKFIIASKFREIFTLMLWFTETQLKPVHTNRGTPHFDNKTQIFRYFERGCYFAFETLVLTASSVVE